MIEVKSGRLNSEDCKKLANLTRSARKGTPLESSKNVNEVAKWIESISTNDAFRIITASDESGEFAGWIYYYVAFPLMTFISGFYPVVDETHESEKTALALIEASKRDTIESGQTRLEIELEFPSDAHRTYSEMIVDWYRKCDFQFAAEEVHKSSDLNTIELPEISPPAGYILRNFSDVSYNLLEEAGFQTFMSGNDELFLSMSNAEQRVTLEHFFDQSEPFIKDASFVVEKDGKVNGFVIVRLKGVEAEIGPIGLIPESRGQGLGTYLLVRALSSLKDIGEINASLDMSITNTPAKKLYEKYGFKDVYYKQFYYWSP